MTSAAFYRTEAERCRELAAGTRDSEAARRWRQIANEYDLLAESMETAQNPPPRATTQSQTMQQQQTKARDEK